MRSLLSAALLLSAVAQAAPVHTHALRLLQAQATTQVPEDETGDEAEDESAEDAAATDEGTTDAAAIEAATAAPTEAPAAASRPRGELVSGAPLANPDVAVHIVERKRFSDQGRHELTLFPVVPQANGKFTQHVGSALGYQYHLQENFALQVGAQYNWYNDESAFNTELVDKVKESAQAASSLLATWGAYAGFEVTPIYGKFAFYEESLAQFGFVLNAGAGIANTRHRLIPPGENDAGVATQATYGDIGLKFLGQVGLGFRVQLGDRFALRLEVRDLVYTARVDRVNGCSLGDIEDLIAGNTVSGGCNSAAFDQGGNRGSNLAISRSLILEPSSDALNLVNFYAGASYLF